MSGSTGTSGSVAKTPKTKLVRITEDEAKDLQWEMISKWKPTRDVWPFTYGVGLLAAATALSGAFFNSHYRKVAQVCHYGQFATLLPAIIVPSIMTAATHQRFISSDILITRSCPVCVQLRAISIQVLFGVAYPLLVTPLGVFSVAGRYYTYPVPPIWPLNYYVRHWWKITSPRINTIGALIFVHAVAAVIMTNVQIASLKTVNQKLDVIEKA